jgi:hypothetical protein
LHFYLQYLQFLPFASDRETFTLEPWSLDVMVKYVGAFCKLVASDSEALTAERGLVKWMSGSPALQAILRVPMRLNMALELYGPGGEVYPRNQTLLKLYEAYIARAIRLEQGRGVMGVEETYRLLEGIAWETYGEGDTARGSASASSERALRTFLATRDPQLSADKIEQEFELVMNLGLLTAVDSGPQRDVPIDFVHKSFQECLVASRAVGAMARSAQECALMYASHLTAEVSEFMKEAIDRVNEQPREVSQAVAIVTDAIQRAGSSGMLPPSVVNAPGRQRLMLQQLCYYLGNLESRPAQEFLVDRLGGETDPWIRRGIAVGLAFGGMYGPLEEYLQLLRAERKRGPDVPLNSANIGYHLSFFGDQPFDPSCPDRDMGFPECGRTVDRLIYQLGTETNRPNWRIDLYTVLDLSNRTPSLDSYWSRMKANLGRLEAVYDRLSHDAGTAAWEEELDLASRIGKLKS